MVIVSLGPTAFEAAVIGLITGIIYTAVKAPIPAPNVLGGILAIVGTFVGYIAVAAIRHQLAFAI